MRKKNIISLSLAFLLTSTVFIACKKESSSGASTTPLNEQVDPTKSTLQNTSNSFASASGERVSGTAKIYLTGNNYQLSLESFSSTNGPALKVYLSKEQQPVNFVNIGDLKSTSGNQVYDIPSGVNVKDYKYVLIYCQQYSQLFGYAQFTF